MPQFAILGSGGFGTTIAIMLAQRADCSVRLWCAHTETANLLREHRENRRQLIGVPIPEEVLITADAEEATRNADCWIVAIPTAFLRQCMLAFLPFAQPRIPILSLTKGLEIETFQRPTQIIANVLKSERLAVLSGPSHAEEVARGAPTSVVIASRDTELTYWLQHYLSTDKFRIYTDPDTIGVELAGALKNVMGIAAGICDGLGYGDNAKSAILTRGLVEMQRFGVAHGAEYSTFMGLAGMGDLITTCFSKHGRNRKLGERLARGERLEDITSGPQIAEGMFTARSVFERVARTELEAPIMTGVYRVLYEGVTPRDAVRELMGRPQKAEKWTLRHEGT